MAKTCSPSTASPLHPPIFPLQSLAKSDRLIRDAALYPDVVTCPWISHQEAGLGFQTEVDPSRKRSGRARGLGTDTGKSEDRGGTTEPGEHETDEHNDPTKWLMRAWENRTRKTMKGARSLSTLDRPSPRKLFSHKIASIVIRFAFRARTLAGLTMFLQAGVKADAMSGALTSHYHVTELLEDPTKPRRR